jgi:hypothetical protein
MNPTARAPGAAEERVQSAQAAGYFQRSVDHKAPESI